MSILVYGSLNIDKIFSVDHITMPCETQSGLGMSISAGGKGANQAAALSRAGGDVYLAGKIGRDGVWITQLLNSLHVNTDFVLTSAEYTGEAIIQVDKNGQNCILLVPGGNEENKIEEMEYVISHFNKGDWLVCQNEISNLNKLVDIASTKGMKICFNPSPFNESLSSFPYEKTDLIIVNEIEGKALSGIESSSYDEIIKALGEKYHNTEIVMTVGKDGAFYTYKGEVVFASGNKVDVVDTTAAGDTFTGFFLVAREVYSMNVIDALTFANKAAASAVSKKGAIASIPSFSDIK